LRRELTVAEVALVLHLHELLERKPVLFRS
jgi:hypothetical protein